MKSLQDLINAQCCHQSGGSFEGATLEAQLAVLPGWSFEKSAITRTFLFENYYETIAFVNALAYIAHAQDHHPDLHVHYNRCVVVFSTHSVGGVSINDFICAAKLNALHAQRFGT